MCLRVASGRTLSTSCRRTCTSSTCSSRSRSRWASSRARSRSELISTSSRWALRRASSRSPRTSGGMGRGPCSAALQRGDHQRERGAQLVGDVGEEVGLHPVQLDLGLDQPLLRVQLPLLAQEGPDVADHPPAEEREQDDADQRGAHQLGRRHRPRAPGGDPLRPHAEGEGAQRGRHRLPEQEHAGHGQHEGVEVRHRRQPLDRLGLQHRDGQRPDEQRQPGPVPAPEERHRVEQGQGHEAGRAAEAERRPAPGRLQPHREVHQVVVEHQPDRGGQQRRAARHHHQPRLALPPELAVRGALQLQLRQQGGEDGLEPGPDRPRARLSPPRGATVPHLVPRRADLARPLHSRLDVR